MTSATQPRRPDLRRRRLLTGTIATVAAAAISGCGSGRQPTQQQELQPSMQPSRTPTGSPAPKVLVAYFSRAGENYDNGDRTWLKVGNTQVVAQLIADLIPCDLHRIEAREPYSDAYDETVARDVASRTPTHVRPSPTRWPASPSTTSSCSAARSGTSAPR